MSRVHRHTRLQRRKLVLEGLERRQVLTAYFVDGDVFPSGTGTEESPFATIREGIEAALTAPGDDEVVIAPKSSGPYVDPIAITPFYSKEQVQGFDQFNGNLLIRGSTGNAEDVVLKSYFGSGIYIDAPVDVTIQSLTISATAGHGVLNRSHNDVVLDNLIIKDHLHQGQNGPYGWSGIIHQGGNLTVRNSQLSNNWQGIWSSFDDSVQPKTAPGSLTVESTVSQYNLNQGIYANALTDGFTTVNYSGVHNGRMGIAAENIGAVAISGGSLSHNAHKGMSLDGVKGATIDRVLVEWNGTLQTEIGTGGAGIRVWPGSSDPIVISNSTIRKNATNRYGGGFEMWNMNSANAPTIRFINTLVTENATPNDSNQNGRGGGISVHGYGNLEILDSTISKNAAGLGGGVYHYSPDPSHYLKIDGSTFSENVSYFNGGLDRIGGRATIANSTFTRNTSSNGAGGLRVNDSRGSMTNVTVSGNTSTNWVGGMTLLWGNGFQVTNSTIANNTGSNVGGLYYPNGGVLTNNVIATNRFRDPTRGTADVGGVGGQSGGGNFIGDGTGGSGFTAPTDRVGTSVSPLDPKLGPLRANGGKTLTHLPLSGSPLIDAGVGSAGVTRAIPLPTTDQRGVPRPQRAGYDIGAVEIANVAPRLDAASLHVAIDEGQTAENRGTFSDIEGDAVRLSASVGTVTAASGGSWQWSLGTADGPEESTTVIITAKDQYGAVTTAEFELVVNNVPPVAQISATSSILSGDEATLSLGATDPSRADTEAGFSYQIDWDSDGDVDQLLGGNPTSAAHVFTELGEHTVTVRAVDKDGAVSEPVTTTLTVLPVTIGFAARGSVDLSSADKGKKTFSAVIPSTDSFDARALRGATATWAGASLYKASFKDVDRDGDTDAIFEFLLADSDALDWYRDALAADPSHSHQRLTTELAATGSSGINYLGAAEVDFFMSGKALKQLLASI